MITNITDLGKPISVQHLRVKGVIENHARYVNGSTCDEYYNTLTKEYRITYCDPNGALIRSEYYDKNGKYKVVQAINYDETTIEEGVSVFTKRISDTDNIL